MTARRALPWLAFLAACATPAGDTGSPSVDSDNREDSAPVVCTPEPPEQVLPSADRVIDDLQAWEGAEAWPDGCVLGFGSWDEVVRRPDGTDSLVADVYCSRGFGNILVVDVAAAEFTAAYSVPTPAAGNVGWDANVDGDGWLHVSGLSGVGFAADNAWTYDERTPDTFGSIALGPDLSWFGTAWMGERLFVLGMAPTTDARGAFRFLPDTLEPQTLNNAEAYFPDWYSAADVGDVDGDGLDDLVAYVRSDSGGAVLVSSADAMAGPDGLPAAFAKPALVDWKFFDGSRPVGDQDGDGLGDLALVEGLAVGHQPESPTVLHLFGGAGPERIAEVIGLTGLDGKLAYIDGDIGPPTLLLEDRGSGQRLLRGPLCGTVEASAATTTLSVPEGRVSMGWVGGPNYVGQFTAAAEDMYDLRAALYIWE